MTFSWFQFINFTRQIFICCRFWRRQQGHFLCCRF